MSTKKDSPCLLKAGDDEPIFVLRAQDKTADVALEAWIEANKYSLGNTHPKLLAAQQTLLDFRGWKKRKYPD
jgi:hypothetical protein